MPLMRSKNNKFYLISLLEDTLFNHLCEGTGAQRKALPLQVLVWPGKAPEMSWEVDEPLSP